MTPTPRTLAAAAALVLAGFAGGFVAGRESSRHASGAPPAEELHAHGVGGGPSEHGVARGHTFSGNVEVPPHGEEGHALAASLLAGAACPCGGCGGEPLLTCGCDTAKEIEGLAAHLLERGRPREEVAAQLRSHYGLALAASAAPGAAPRNLDGPLDDLSGLLEGRPRGPIDVPSSARPGAN